MQKLVFFIGSNDKNYGLASNIGNLYMNQFTIDEDAGHEIDNIYEIEEFRGMGHNFFEFLNISLFTLSTIALNLTPVYTLSL